MSIRRFILPTIISLVLSVQAMAQDGITPAALVPAPTFESIAIKAPFTGDLNKNTTATVQFRETGTQTWKDGCSLCVMVDRRPMVNGVANVNTNQGRVSIMGLKHNTQYEVQWVWFDPDAPGTMPLVATVTTLNLNPPSGGGTFYVASFPLGNDSTGDGSSLMPWATHSKCESSTAPGDTCVFRSGTYTVNITKSGLPTAYRYIKTDALANVHFAGNLATAKSVGTTVSARYVRITASGTGGTITVDPSGGTSISVSSAASDHVYLEDLILPDVAVGLHPKDGTDQGYYAGIALGSQDSIYIQRVTMRSARTVSSSGPFIDGIVYTRLTNSVVADTSIIGSDVDRTGFWDGIGNTSNNSPSTGLNFVNQDNVDFARIKVKDYRDDPQEFDGAAMNVRLYDAEFTTTRSWDVGKATVAISLAPVTVGPLYVHHSYFKPAGDSYYGLKFGPVDPEQVVIWWINNTLETPGIGSHETSQGVRGLLVRNSIFKSASHVINGTVVGFGDLDYDVLFPRSTSFFVASNWDGTVDYLNAVAFRTCTFKCPLGGNENHGMTADPLIDPVTGKTTVQSPGFNKGLIIPNINSLDSKWPYSGIAPEIGYNEVPEGTPIPVPTPTPVPVPTAPIPGNGGTIAVSNIRSSSLGLTWTAATGTTPKYEVRRSMSNNMGTVAEAEANGVVVKAYTAGLTSYNPTGLTIGNIYYFTVVVESGGLKSVYRTVEARYGWHNTLP